MFVEKSDMTPLPSSVTVKLRSEMLPTKGGGRESDAM